MTIADVLLQVRTLGARDAAIRFATAGLPIFPCEPGGKRPLTGAGFLAATCDLKQITAWWRRSPRANIGMPTGQTSGIDVVDVDIKPEGSGFPMLRSAVSAGLLDGEIARVRTPSGGLHIYFPVNTSPQRCWQAARSHIDFRGDGGYVVVPPSIALLANGAMSYRPFSLSSAPARPIDARALREFVDPQPAQETRAPQGAVSSEALGRWVSRLREGERNHGLFWAACRLSEAGVVAEAIVDVLGPAAEQIGLDAQEIERTVTSACRHTLPNRAHTAALKIADGPPEPRLATSARRFP
ncbi:Bifunctional DNA primase/polymerase, N-terminal [Microbacterium sp. cf046]|uniref:bifunctional DNA primase/polymerase n=1 Tax=Microbacterium sp. cf046 TaxID=1761803 RepID=UPI0008F11C60|nr:bifunctional DNA primase/polymerase [Microbacterium sp. cf046]SFS16566.1 Bifunctional DNA primase/polymerase, N-terminal [Microbacterium sp. cf046]